MKWLKEVLLVLVTKLSSWQAFAICLIGLGGYMGIKFYEKQTERLIATAQIPKAEKVVDWVETKSTLAGVGVENKSSDDKAMMRMTLIIEEKKAWWKRKEFYGSVIASTIPILTLFPTHTTAWKVGISLNALAGGLLTFFGVMRGYKANNLYKPIDDAITFVLPEGLRREK